MITAYGSSSLVSLAKTHLVKARSARQAGENLRDQIERLRVNPIFFNVLPSEYLRTAKWHRGQARQALRKSEELNGALYMWSEPYVPLFKSLNGKDFKNWPEYQEEYNGEVSLGCGDTWL